MRIDVKGHVFYFFHKKYVWTTGIRSNCKDGKHVLFLDFDDEPLSKVMACLRMIQNVFACGTFHVFESSPNSYHAICIDKFKFNEILIVQRIVGVDSGFITSGIYRGYWTLRCESKGDKLAPKYLLSLIRESVYDKSSAHARYLSLKYGLSLNGTDNNYVIALDRYLAGINHSARQRHNWRNIEQEVDLCQNSKVHTRMLLKE